MQIKFLVGPKASHRKHSTYHGGVGGGDVVRAKGGTLTRAWGLLLPFPAVVSSSVAAGAGFSMGFGGPGTYSYKPVAADIKTKGSGGTSEFKDSLGRTSGSGSAAKKGPR